MIPCAPRLRQRTANAQTSGKFCPRELRSRAILLMLTDSFVSVKSPARAESLSLDLLNRRPNAHRRALYLLRLRTNLNWNRYDATLIVHRHEDIQISRPGRSARSRTVSFTLPLPCVTNFTLSEDSRAKPSPSSTVYITSSACAPRGALNSSSSAVVPAFCRRPPDRARTSTGACILVAIVNGVYPLIHAINMATAFSFRFIERLISISLG